MTEELKPLPCPFCGGKEITRHDNGEMECVACGAFGPDADNHADVGDPTWNTRSPAWRDIESAPKFKDILVSCTFNLGGPDDGYETVVWVDSWDGEEWQWFPTLIHVPARPSMWCEIPEHPNFHLRPILPPEEVRG